MWRPRHWPGRRRCCKTGPVLVYSTADSSAVKAIQGQLGVEEAGAMVERTIAAIARGLVEQGVRQLVVAGWRNLGRLCAGAEHHANENRPADRPGRALVPCALSDARRPEGLHITLKSGNFGTDDFFTQAFTILQ
jgi:uncharacterized protein YgbK (DUF1537 family)